MPFVAPQDRHVAVPEEPTDIGILVLAGSSGRLDAERAELFARAGIRAHAIRWFGGEGQRPAPHEVPIELFQREIELLRQSCDRAAILGTSFGAEAALLTAAHTSVDAVIAIAPSSVVWPWSLNGEVSSHWTIATAPVPFVPLAEEWAPDTDPPEFRSLYERSLEQHPKETAAASIPVEQIPADVLLVAGGDDRVWPSDRFADDIATRRSAHGLRTEVVSHPQAGHRIIFPGETPSDGGRRMARGGSPEADAALGADAWSAILRLL